MHDRQSPYRVTTGQPIGPSLDWIARPALGADARRRAFRARIWRTVLLGLAGFWAGLLGALLTIWS